jgi:hypothetical protein
MTTSTGRTTPPPFEQPLPDVEAGIRATIADYYLGWYDGDARRMERALHPELAKRGWIVDEEGERQLGADDYRSMVDATAAGIGRRDVATARAYDVGPIVVYDDVASAHVHAVPYVDYLHLVRTADGWRIINAIWRRP